MPAGGSGGHGLPQNVYVLGALAAVVLLVAPSCVVGYLTRPRERSAFASLVTTLGFSLALLVVGCVPIDIFATSNAAAFADDVAAAGAGKLHSSAAEAVRMLYEGLFSLLLANTFVLVPLAFFYVGEPPGDQATGGCRRLCTALRYTFCFEVALAVVTTVAIVLKPGTDVSTFHQNEVAWIKNWATNAAVTNKYGTLRFLVAGLSCLGAFPWLTFTAYGVARLPLTLLRGESLAARDARLASPMERRGLLSTAGGSAAAGLEADYGSDDGSGGGGGGGGLAGGAEQNPLDGSRYGRWKRGERRPSQLKKGCCSSICGPDSDCARSCGGGGGGGLFTKLTTWLLLRPVQLVLGALVSRTARKGRETQGKAVITAFKGLQEVREHSGRRQRLPACLPPTQS
eukprot:SAG22_NODE_1616_length_3986_cov_2.289169_1_plen_399_part_00